MEICGFSMTAALSYRSRALTALALALPIPLLAALGLSLPLPATVQRLAAGLVPFADHATIEAAPRNGSIVPAPGERPAAIGPGAAPSGNQGLIVRSGRVVKVRGENLSPAVDIPRSTPRADAQNSTTGAPGSTPSSTTTASQPVSGATEPQQDPVPTQPDPTTTPTPTPPNVVGNTVTTIANTATTATDAAKTTVDGAVSGLPHP
jgi:hypothetical protein